MNNTAVSLDPEVQTAIEVLSESRDVLINASTTSSLMEFFAKPIQDLEELMEATIFYQSIEGYLAWH